MESHIAESNMIKQQLRTGDVLNETILGLYQEIHREDFVPKAFRSIAYSDAQIDLPHHQRMLTPLEEALALQALDLKGHEVVLEVGTGSGFFTALLSRLCQKVISVDYYDDFRIAAKPKFEQYHCKNIELLTGDGSRGWVDLAPYDVIVITGGIEKLTEEHRLQVNPCGKLFAIVGQQVQQGQIHHQTQQGQWHYDVLYETHIPALIDPLKTKAFVF